MSTSYDIIGDIHGHADKLKALLTKLGYAKTLGTWRHPSRTAIFVGDFIDRGPNQLDTLQIVRCMVDDGAAMATMGNHEFNAIAWHTKDPENPGTFLRTRDGEKGRTNRRQHEAFLSEIQDQPDLHHDWIRWFYTLPLWLDLPGLRVVHACWHEAHIATLAPRLGPGNTLTKDLVVDASRPGNPAFASVETLLKGVETPMPEGLSFRDKDQHVRRSVRVRWWDPAATTFRSAAIGPLDLMELPDTPIPAAARVKVPTDKPLFFGHYWMRGNPTPQTDTAACVDYSVASGGPLVAYRWEGEVKLDSRKFAMVGHA